MWRAATDRTNGIHYSPSIEVLPDMLSLNDNGAAFDVSLLEASPPVCIVLFAVGSGGNPERHLPLLTSLAEHSCTVVAPHF